MGRYSFVNFFVSNRKRNRLFSETSAAATYKLTEPPSIHIRVSEENNKEEDLVLFFNSLLFRGTNFKSQRLLQVASFGGLHCCSLTTKDI